MGLTETFRDLFLFLKENDYQWEPQTPDHLMRCRKNATAFSPLTQAFGLGIPFSEEALYQLGVPLQVCPQVAALRPAVSTMGGVFIAHDHWPPRTSHETNFVYYGNESTGLLRHMESSFEQLVGCRVIDLGCGSGALALSLGALAQEVLGLDIAAKAIVWAAAGAKAQGFSNIEFINEKIGGANQGSLIEEASWDAVVFNPPMAISRDDKTFPHRNGGHLGLELPLKFLDFSFRALKRGGDVFFLATNPIVKNRSLLFDKISSKQWHFIEKKCLHSHFNQSVYRKDGYFDLGIERVELWYLHLRKS